MHKALRILPVLYFLHASGVGATGLPQGTTVTTGSAQTQATLTRLDDNSGTMLVFKVQNPAMSLADQGQALDDLLGQVISRNPLPDGFDLRLAATRAALIKALQQRLMQPGANWDPASGKPRKGELDAVLIDELNALLTRSPIGIAFAHHGYGLRVDNIAHIEEDPPSFPRAGARVPTEIMVMEITGRRSARAIR